MKTSRWITASLVTAALAAPRLARAEPPSEAMKKAAELQEWPECLLQARHHPARADRVPDDSKGAPLAKPVGSLAAGATPTATELEAECLAQAKADPKAADEWTSNVQIYVGIRGNIHAIESGESNDYDGLLIQIDRCNDVLDYALQVIDPGTEVTLGGAGVAKWTGSVAESRQFCDQARKVGDVVKEKLEAPFRKVLKNDKLTLALEMRKEGYYLSASGGSNHDPKALAAHDVWFEEWDHGTCSRGKVIQMIRHQFGKDQKLVKTSSHDYCGDPPASAYR